MQMLNWGLEKTYELGIGKNEPRDIAIVVRLDK